MSYHDNNPRLTREVADRAGPAPIVPLRTIAMTYVFAPGHPKVPKGATHARVLGRGGGKLTMEFYRPGRGGELKSLGKRKAKWFQTGPVSPSFKTQPWWTKTGYWGPMITPESVVRPVEMSRPSALGLLMAMVR